MSGDHEIDMESTTRKKKSRKSSSYLINRNLQFLMSCLTTNGKQSHCKQKYNISLMERFNVNIMSPCYEVIKIIIDFILSLFTFQLLRKF